jgi:hypothetical protein
MGHTPSERGSQERMLLASSYLPVNAIYLGLITGLTLSWGGSMMLQHIGILRSSGYKSDARMKKPVFLVENGFLCFGNDNCRRLRLIKYG